MFTSSGSTGGRGGDAKTIILPNILFGDIMILCYLGDDPMYKACDGV